MRLYMVEPSAFLGSPYFYWAENEGDAIDQHEAQGGNPEMSWVASAVWANNINKKYRGYVVGE